jgi:hypothetical protein
LVLLSGPTGNFSIFFYIRTSKYHFGGKSKTSKQVQNTEAYLVAADDIETGFGIKVPLWLFGFLY